MWALSMIMTELGAGNGCIWSRRPSIKSQNRTVVNEPSMIFAWIMPSRKVWEEGSTYEHLQLLWNSPEKQCCAYRLPQTKKHCHTAHSPRRAHACFQMEVQWSKELSSIKTVCSGVYLVPYSYRKAKCLASLRSSASCVSYKWFITMSHITTKQELTFFIVKPLLLSDLHSVALLTSIPLHSSRISHSSVK